MRAVGVDSAVDVLRLSKGHHVVGIDEVQLFEPAIVDVARELVRRGVRVVVAGLDMDFRGEPFESMPTLLCLAEVVDKLHAICHRCGATATRTQRIVDGRPAPFSAATIQIGALDAYQARCSKCYETDPTARLVAAG
jgi:thymidine kinase